MLDNSMLSLLKPTVSKLALKDPPSETSKVQKYGWNYSDYQLPSVDYGSGLGEQVSHFYCLCRTRKHAAQASSVLSWLDKESKNAHVIAYRYVLVPFLKTIGSITKEYGLDIPNKLKSTCTSLTRNLTARYIGPEPKPTDWKRETSNLCTQSCSLCEAAKAFFGDPDKKEAVFSKKLKGHLREQGWKEWHGELVEDGFKIVKREDTRDTAIDCRNRLRWLNELHEEFPSREMLKELYGNEYEELMGLLDIKPS
ncbi:MAG: hypothetical protein Q9222_006780 [Ikaeria aurantiellina]